MPKEPCVSISGTAKVAPSWEMVIELMASKGPVAGFGLFMVTLILQTLS
jgi:hypothetical protein